MIEFIGLLLTQVQRTEGITHSFTDGDRAALRDLSGRPTITSLDSGENFGPSRVRRAFHHLRHPPTERHDARLGLATPHDRAPADIPGGEILQRTATSIVVLHPTRATRSGGRAGVTTDPGLDARLLVGAEDGVLGAAL